MNLFLLLNFDDVFPLESKPKESFVIDFGTRFLLLTELKGKPYKF